MAVITKVAVVGASGNFGGPITAALRQAGLNVTIISRHDSQTQHPEGIPVIHTAYDLEHLTQAFSGQDAAVCVVGPGGIAHQTTLIDAAEAAGVKRFIIDDFGWGPDVRGLPEFAAIHAQRRAGWDYAKARADANPAFTWTGVTSGNPIDWAMAKFPLMGFDVPNSRAIIYDAGTESFTGTTLAGIGQAVLGVMRHPDETANRFVKVLSLQTHQNELLQAFEKVTGREWEVSRATTKELIASGKAKFKAGSSGWVLELVVGQLFDAGEARCVVAPSREESDSALLGVAGVSAEALVHTVVEQVAKRQARAMSVE
ncbi:hypothetical protein LTR36_010409 [Oleoguttula mirabilis]|uniref:NmrA-like domain-containing protein n=1 Tax=Oleoguttula mirabilis TaxID=1507867 RepID=A0AAV9J491_9PEZI|nr:hypothetical protein LTR36_010409 [Oleoguttula mirabilis]